MDIHIIALFGEAERGAFNHPHQLNSLEELSQIFGEPPPDSQGLFLATKALLFGMSIIYTRVTEEGFSKEDYFRGIEDLRYLSFPITGLCLPGVGDPEIIEAFYPICDQHKSLFLFSERDLYDYLTAI